MTPSTHAHFSKTLTTLVLLAGLIAACGDGASMPDDMNPDEGGASGTDPGTGGTNLGAGGDPTTGTGSGGTPITTASGGSGGTSVGTGGTNPGSTGGMAATGGSATGGTSTGGSPSTGGSGGTSVGTGGTNPGSTGGMAATGGSATGGASTGGSATGGTSTGGSPSTGGAGGTGSGEVPKPKAELTKEDYIRPGVYTIVKDDADQKIKIATSTLGGFPGCKAETFSKGYLFGEYGTGILIRVAVEEDFAKYEHDGFNPTYFQTYGLTQERLSSFQQIGWDNALGINSKLGHCPGFPRD